MTIAFTDLTVHRHTGHSTTPDDLQQVDAAHSRTLEHILSSYKSFCCTHIGNWLYNNCLYFQFVQGLSQQDTSFLWQCHISLFHISLEWFLEFENISYMYETISILNIISIHDNIVISTCMPPFAIFSCNYIIAIFIKF